MHALLKRERSDREAGFTLIELLVVVAIIGILAAIAIPVFLNQRASARDASVKADLNGIAKVMETVYAEQGAYPDGDDTDLQAAFDGASPVTSPGNAIVIQSSTTDFKISGCNAESGNMFFYASSAGGLQTDTEDITTCTGSTPGEVVEPTFGTVNLPGSGGGTPTP